MASCRFSGIEGESLRRLPPICGFENEKFVPIQEAIKPLEKIIPNIDQMLQTARDDMNLKHGLTIDEHLALRLYTLEWITQDKSLYILLNKALRDPERDVSLLPWFKFLLLILTALSKLPSTDTRTVYCGVKLNLRDKYKQGERIVWWGFSSCTTTIETLEDKFLGKTGPRTLFAVESNTGKDISFLSFLPNENEILFTPGREFEIIESLDMGNDLCIVQVKEVKPEFPNIADFPPKNVVKVSYKRKGITDDKVANILEETLEKQKCTHLDLSENHITARGAEIIATALKNNKIRRFPLHRFQTLQLIHQYQD